MHMHLTDHERYQITSALLNNALGKIDQAQAARTDWRHDEIMTGARFDLDLALKTSPSHNWKKCVQSHMHKAEYRGRHEEAALDGCIEGEDE